VVTLDAGGLKERERKGEGPVQAHLLLGPLPLFPSRRHLSTLENLPNHKNFTTGSRGDLPSRWISHKTSLSDSRRGEGRTIFGGPSFELGACFKLVSRSPGGDISWRMKGIGRAYLLECVG